MKRKIIELLIILFFLALQCTLGRFISLNGIAPNFLIILPVIFGFLNGSNEGIVVGFVSGLLFDVYSNNTIGFGALIFLFTGYLCGLFNQKYEESELFIPLCAIFAGDFMLNFLTYVFGFLLHNKLDIPFYLSRIIIPEAVYTVIVGLVLYPIFRPVNKLLDKRERKRVDILDERSI